MLEHLRPAVVSLLLLTLLTGLAYPLAVLELGQALFPHQSGGSLIERDGVVVGSSLIGQPYQSPGYFHGRPSAAGDGYDATASGGSNLGPSSTPLQQRMQLDLARWQQRRPGVPVPLELITASASGLDPQLSPAAVAYQLPLVATARGIAESEVRALVLSQTQGRPLDLLGMPTINVLELNLALDKLNLGQ